MRISLVLLFLFPAVLGLGQSIQELESQLRQAESSQEKMSLQYQLGEAWLKADAKKSIDYSKQAHQLANQLGNNGLSAEAAYLISRGYDRTGDDRNEDVWLRSATQFAMLANDADLIIKTVDTRSRLAERKRDTRKALQIVQEAFDYFSKKGGKSISQMQAQYDVQRAKLEREKRLLEEEKHRLEGDISGLSRERDNLKEDKTVLTAKHQQLQAEKATVEEEISRKEEAIQAMDAEKREVLLMAEYRRLRIDSLETRQAMDSLALVQKETALENAQLLNEQGKYLFYILGVASIFTILLSFLLYLRYLAKKRSTAMLAKQNKIIEAERERSDELLHNIMPAAVAKELKETGSATAQEFPEATVMFTDFKNFTTVAERLKPEQLVHELNECFRAFDHIISQHPEIEKIKTIGDAYLCASGLVKHKTMPKGIVQAALDIQEYLEDHKQEKIRQGLPYFEARIGLHTGPVVAGVVGFKKYAYDIWGDTVNLAARMESHCDSGQVNISETTFGLVKYNFECQSRRQVNVKNKGMMGMYYVLKGK